MHYRLIRNMWPVLGMSFLSGLVVGVATFQLSHNAWASLSVGLATICILLTLHVMKDD